MWTTQSESNMIGYHILRAETEELSDAMRISRNIIVASNQTETNNYSFTDTETTENTTYYYWLLSAEFDGTCEYFGPIYVKTKIVTEDPLVIPLSTRLNSAYPNPFNPSRTVSFDIKEMTNVKIEIFNIKGQRVKQLVNQEVAPGRHKVVWNDLDDNQRDVSSGVYFYKMQAGKYTQTNKILMMQ